MSDIYVIVAGEYSSKCILGATTDFDRAKQLVLEYDNDYDIPRIMVFEDSAKLDLYADKGIYEKYWVRFNENGEVVDLTEQCDTEYMYDENYNKTDYYSKKNGYYVVIADNMESAIKIAKDEWAIDRALELGL